MSNLGKISLGINEKGNENCLCAIYIVLTYGNWKVKISTHILVPENMWDARNMRVKEYTEGSVKINCRLTKLMSMVKMKLHQLHDFGKLNGMNAEELRLEIINGMINF